MNSLPNYNLKTQINLIFTIINFIFLLKIIFYKILIILAEKLMNLLYYIFICIIYYLLILDEFSMNK